MLKTILHVGLIVIEAWFRGYWGSPGLGDLRTAGLSPWAGLLDYERYKIEDFVSCPDGTLLGVEGKLGNMDMDISSFVTNLV